MLSHPLEEELVMVFDGHAGTTAVLCMLDLADDELLKKKKIIIADSEHCLAVV